MRVSLVAGAGLRASGCLGTGEGSVIDDSTAVVLAEIGAAIMGGWSEERSEEVVSAFSDKVTLASSGTGAGTVTVTVVVTSDVGLGLGLGTSRSRSRMLTVSETFETSG